MKSVLKCYALKMSVDSPVVISVINAHLAAAAAEWHRDAECLLNDSLAGQLPSSGVWQPELCVSLDAGLM